MGQKEQDIQRFLQIREEIHEEIKKIQPSVSSLQEAIKRFVSHFDVFQKLSQNAQEHMKSALKEASHEMVEIAADAFSEKIENQLQETIRKLDQAVKNGSQIFDRVNRTKSKHLRNLACVGCLLSTFFGFGFGYIYAKKNTYFLSRDVLEAYLLGSNLQKAWSKMSSKEKQQLRTVLEK